MKKVLAIVLAIAMISAIGISAAAAKDTKSYNLKCSTFVNSGAPELQLLQDFADEVNAKTDGNVTITIFPGEQLGGYEQTFEETMRGTIEFGINSPAATFDNRLSSTTLVGGIFSDFDTVAKVVAPGSTLYNTFADAMDGLGLKFLGFFPGGFYNLVFNTDIPENYADPSVSKDTVIRVNTWEITDKTIQAYNYRTATLPGSELYTGLETGIVDGCIGLDYGLVLSAFSDVCKNIVETKTMLSCDSVFMNKKLFDSMPAEYQAVIEECALNFQNACIEYQRSYEQQAKEGLIAKGIEIVELSDEEMAAMNAVLQEQVWPYIVEQFGQEFLDGVKADAGIA